MTHADDWPPENIFEKAIRYRGIGTDPIALSKFKQDHFFKPQINPAVHCFNKFKTKFIIVGRLDEEDMIISGLIFSMLVHRYQNKS